MNFYSCAGYLDTIAEIYFPGRRASIENVRIGYNNVLRLLVVDSNNVITSAPFLDYHEPLHDSEYTVVSHEWGFAERVVREVVQLTDPEAEVTEEIELAPFVDWSQFATYDDYQAYLLNRDRRQIGDNERRRRRLTEVFDEITFHVNDEGEDVLDTARRWKERQLLERDVKSCFADPRTSQLLGLLRRKGLLTASTLRANGRLFAISVGFVHNRVSSGWIFTYDPDFTRYAPGHQLLNAMLAESFRLKHREFDFSIGDQDYKRTYATHARLLGSIGRPPLLKRARALAKKAQKRTPKLYGFAKTLKQELIRRSFMTNADSAVSRSSHSET